MNDFLTKFLAGLFDKFKLDNPKAAAFVLLVLGLLMYFATQGTLLGLFTLPQWASQLIVWVSAVVGALTGSRTSRYMAKK